MPWPESSFVAGNAVTLACGDIRQIRIGSPGGYSHREHVERQVRDRVLRRQALRKPPEAAANSPAPRRQPVYEEIHRGHRSSRHSPCAGTGIRGPTGRQPGRWQDADPGKTASFRSGPCPTGHGQRCLPMVPSGIMGGAPQSSVCFRLQIDTDHCRPPGKTTTGIRATREKPAAESALVDA